VRSVIVPRPVKTARRIINHPPRASLDSALIVRALGGEKIEPPPDATEWM
jgi:hypothetical protein